MGVQITIRNVPDGIRDALAEKAASERKSMQEYLLGELQRLAEQRSVAQWLERVRRRKAEEKTTVGAAEILHHRDADRRFALAELLGVPLATLDWKSTRASGSRCEFLKPE